MDYFDRPLSLAEAPHGYATTVTDMSMEPRYHPGEMVYVHPNKPTTAGSYVLVQLRNRTEGEPTTMLIRRLVKKTGTKIVLAQLNPAKRFDIALNDVLCMHRIVGNAEYPSERSALP